MYSLLMTGLPRNPVYSVPVFKGSAFAGSDVLVLASIKCTFCANVISYSKLSSMLQVDAAAVLCFVYLYCSIHWLWFAIICYKDCKQEHFVCSVWYRLFGYYVTRSVDLKLNSSSPSSLLTSSSIT